MPFQSTHIHMFDDKSKWIKISNFHRVLSQFSTGKITIFREEVAAAFAGFTKGLVYERIFLLDSAWDFLMMDGCVYLKKNTRHAYVLIVFASLWFRLRFETWKSIFFRSSSQEFQLEKLLARSKSAIETQKLSLFMCVFLRNFINYTQLTAIPVTKQYYHFRGLWQHKQRMVRMC